MASLLFLQDTLFHMMHSLIPCLSRADIPPGRSISVTVTGAFTNIQQSTTHIIQFSTRPFWGSYPTVNRAVYLSLGVSPVSTVHKKRSCSFYFMNLFHLYPSGSQANSWHGCIHQQTACYGHIYYYSPLFIS